MFRNRNLQFFFFFFLYKFIYHLRFYAMMTTDMLSPCIINLLATSEEIKVFADNIAPALVNAKASCLQDYKRCMLISD